MDARVVVAAMGVALALSGCLGGSKGPVVALPDAAVRGLGVLVHNASGLLDPAAYTGPAIDVAYRLVGHVGGEPNIGVTSKGTLFTTASEATMRSRDHGATWEVVHDFGLVYTPLGVPARFTSDPMLWVDPATDRVFANHMWPPLVCSDMIISDDEGATWLDKPMTCGLPGVDHQKVMTARPGPEGAWPLPVYPNVVYYCYNKLLSTNCAVSLDGGLSFPYDTVVLEGVVDCGGVNGHPGAAPDGTVYVVMSRCGAVHVGVTRDSGLTWEARDTGYRASGVGIDDEVAVTKDGTVYVLFAGPDHRQYLGRSPDEGRTWQGPWVVSPPGVKSTYFEGLVAGDAGRLAFAYLGTRDGRGENPEHVPDDARWHLFYGFTENADTDDPTFVTHQVTPDEDPVQVGCIWVSGFPSGPCRNLLDFIDMVIDREGRPYIAYTEGCVSGCADKAAATGSDSRASEGAVAVLDHGPSLFRDVGNLTSLGLVDKPLP